MALSFTTQEATIRTAIAADVLTAWNAKKIYHSPAEVPTSPDGLPVVFIELADPTTEEDYCSVKHDGIRLEYTIAGHFIKPTEGTLHAAKMTKLNSLRSLLTAGPYYHGNNRMWLGDGYSAQNNEEESTDNDYKVSVRFAVIVLVEVG